MSVNLNLPNTAQIKSVATKLAGKPLLYASKGLAVVATSAILYDAHKNGVEGAIVKDNNDTANRLHRQHRQWQISSSNSATICKMKDAWYDIQQSFPFNHSTSKFLGYLGGFGKTILKNTPVLALSVVSLVAKNPKISKAAGCLIGAYGANVVGASVLSAEVRDRKI